MKNDENTFATIIRLDLRTPEGRKAHKLLTQRDKKKYHSYGDLVAAVLSEYYDRQAKLLDDPYLETREKEDAFLKRIEDRIAFALWKDGSESTPVYKVHYNESKEPNERMMNSEDLDTAMDFINRL